MPFYVKKKAACINIKIVQTACALARFNQKNGQLDSFFSYSGGGCSGLRWFVVVCLHRLWFHCYVPNSSGDLWWFAVISCVVVLVFSRWFAVVCGDLR